MTIEKMTVHIPFNSAREIMSALSAGLGIADDNITLDAHFDGEVLITDIKRELEKYQRVLEERNGM